MSKNTPHTTTHKDSAYHGKSVETTADLGGGRVLIVCTSKWDGWVLACRASVYTRSEGGGLAHSFALSRFGTGDYAKELGRAAGRATGKALQALHASCLEGSHGCVDGLDAVVEEARAYYAAQDAARTT